METKETIREILIPCELVKDLEDQVVNQIEDLFFQAISDEKEKCKKLLNSGRGMYEQGKKDERVRLIKEIEKMPKYDFSRLGILIASKGFYLKRKDVINLIAY